MPNLKVLVVDDEPFTCQLVARMLKLYGYEAVILSDPSQVQHVASIEKPALILMDYHLGGRRGLDILESLQADPDLQLIPVVMTSGVDYTRESLAGGAVAFLQKPYEPQVLLDTVKAKIAAV